MRNHMPREPIRPWELLATKLIKPVVISVLIWVVIAVVLALTIG